MNEALLHTIWKYKLLGQNKFVGTKGETIEIVAIGEHNQDSGPDFFSSKVLINDVLLVGNVEIHIKTSDWLKHKHQLNKAYDNLVLHVVYEHDVELPQNELFNVSVVELKNIIKRSLIEQYSQLELSKQMIPCGKSITMVSDIVWKSWMDRLAISRIEEKTKRIDTLFQLCHQNYEDTLYVLLSRNFGFKINNDAFELLGKSIPYSILKKHADQPIQIEALLFGTAGFLDELFTDAYPKLLQNEYEFLKHKYQLVPLKKELWKFSKTRPVNFPTIRISQLAHLIGKQQSLFHVLEKQPTLLELKAFFNIETTAYWKTHYKFDTEVEESFKPLGESAFHTIVINTIIPFLFFMSERNFNIELKEHAMDILAQLPAEVNTKTKAYTNLGVKTASALESQAQIQLYDFFCSIKACLHCHVGQALLKKSV